MAIFRAANGTRGSSFLNPDTVVIHPSNWQPIRAGTDASGQYYGGGPFSYGPYGSQTAGATNYLMQPDNLWGMRVLVTSAITVGTALVGSFSQGAALLRKGGLRVEASNSPRNLLRNGFSGNSGRASRSPRGVPPERIRGGGRAVDLMTYSGVLEPGGFLTGPARLPSHERNKGTQHGTD
jgi:hypothetical protein